MFECFWSLPAPISHDYHVNKGESPTFWSRKERMYRLVAVCAHGRYHVRSCHSLDSLMPVYPPAVYSCRQSRGVGVCERGIRDCRIVRLNSSSDDAGRVEVATDFRPGSYDRTTLNFASSTEILDDKPDISICTSSDIALRWQPCRAGSRSHIPLRRCQSLWTQKMEEFWGRMFTALQGQGRGNGTRSQ